MSENPAQMRLNGEKLIARGRAMIERAYELEADAALGNQPADLGARWAGSIAAVARSMAEDGWFTARALQERSGGHLPSVRSVLWRMVERGELVTRSKEPWPMEYGPAGCTISGGSEA